MKQRTFALLLAGALALSLLGAGALAAEGDISITSEGQAGTAASTREDEGAPAEAYIPDPEGTLSFANLNRRMYENNLQILAIQESVNMLEEIDYDDLQDDLRSTLNQLAQAQWAMLQMSKYGTVIGSGEGGFGAIVQINQTGILAYDKLSQTYTAVREQFDAIKDGDLQADNADTVRQLKNLQNQIVMAGEATYIALAAMEIQDGGLERQLSALDRTIQELELRYELGHISSLTLQQAQAGRTALTSALSTLRMNLNTYKGQLELLLGADITGEISLGALPRVTQQELDDMELERDLETAKANSWSLYEAAGTLEDAEEAYDDAGGDNSYDRKKDNISYMRVRHSWFAAQYTYDNTVQNFELGLRNLYLKVQDYKQILDAAKTALAVEQDSYAAAQLKHSQGTLSLNGLLEAEDKLSEAKEKVAGAENDLFSAYNTYRWAVDYGILN